VARKVCASNRKRAQPYVRIACERYSLCHSILVMNCINSGGKPLPMSAATAITTQNPSPLRRKTFYFCVLRRPSRFCPSGNSSQNTHCETQANLRCSGLNTDFLRCTAFREYPRAERSITRRRAKHPNTPSAQPIRLSRLNAGLLRTSSKIERRFKWGNMAVWWELEANKSRLG